MKLYGLRQLRVFLLVIIATGLLGGARGLTRAQSDEVDTDLLLKIELDASALPTVPAFIRLVRMTLEPGASGPEHTHPGPEISRIETGLVTLDIKGKTLIKQRSAKESDPFVEATVGDTIQLDRGDQILYPAGTPVTFRNEGEELAEILALVILPARDTHPPLIDYAGDDPSDASFNGLTSEILGDGIATALPEGPSEVTIERVNLKEGQSLPGSRNPVLYSVESGNCEFTVLGGSVQITRKRDPGPQNDAPLDEDQKLRSGDAMFFANGVRTTSRGDNSADLTLLRVIIAPTTDGERLSEVSRGQIRFKVPEQSTADETATAEALEEETTAADAESGSDSGWSAGDSVYVNSTDVNLRDSPGINGALVTVLLYGQEMIIDGESVEADGIVWWPVHIAADPSIFGYVTQEFIQSDPAE